MDSIWKRLLAFPESIAILGLLLIQAYDTPKLLRFGVYSHDCPGTRSFQLFWPLPLCLSPQKSGKHHSLTDTGADAKGNDQHLNRE